MHPDVVDLEKLYMKHADLVYRYLLSLCHNAALAEDLTSETFLRAAQSRFRYNGSSKVSVWLCGIAKHVLYRYYENAAKLPSDTDLSAVEALPDASAEDIYFRRETLRRLYADIDSLSEKQRDVFRLRIFAGASFSVIAGMLSISETNARVLFYRAKEALRKGDFYDHKTKQ